MDKKRRARGEFLRFLKFALCSASAGLIETGLFYLLGLVPALGYWERYLPALAASVLWNFTLNRRFTFQSAANVPRAMAKVFGYYAVFTPISTVLGDYLTEELYAGQAIAGHIVFASTLLVNFVTEFLYQRYFVFKGEIDNRTKEGKGNQG